MHKVSATHLRTHLFDYLNKAAAGETIIIERNNQEVARLVPIQLVDWRTRMTITPQILVSPEEFIQPMEEIWAEYL